MSVFSCESRHDDNGSLSGNWQMTTWYDSDSVAERDMLADGIFYSVSLELIKIWQPGKSRIYYLASFVRDGDSLFLVNAYVSPNDSVVSFEDMAPYGVESDGRFRIVSNDSKTLILSGKTKTLVFRSY